MIVRAFIVDGPVTSDAERLLLTREATKKDPRQGPGLVGARVRFEGIVRLEEPRGDAHSGERAAVGELAALAYTAYEPMATGELERIASEVGAAFGVEAMFVLHSRGRVGVGEVSFVLIIESAHRGPALRAMSEFIDRMKRDVPIWKMPVWAAKRG